MLGGDAGAAAGGAGAAAAVLPAGLRVLQGDGRPEAADGPVRRDHPAEQAAGAGGVQVPAQGHRQLRHRRGDVRPAQHHRGRRGPARPPQGRDGGDGRDLPRRPRRALRPVRRAGGRRHPPRRRRHPRRERVHVLPRAVAVGARGAPLRPPRGRQGVQPHRDGMQRHAHRPRPRQQLLQDPRGAGGAGDDVGVDRAQLVRRQQALLHAGQLPVPLRRVRLLPHQRPPPPPARQAPPPPRRAHPHRRLRGGLQLRAPDGGRRRPPRLPPRQGAPPRRRPRLHPQPPRPGAPGAPRPRAPPLRLRHPLRPPRPQEQAARLQPPHHPHEGRRRPLLRPHRRRRRDRRRRQGAHPHGARPRAVPDDAAPLRQHLRQQRLVRAGVHGGQGEAPQGRPGAHAHLRRRVQVQQLRLDRGEAGHRRRRLEGPHRPVPAQGRLQPLLGEVRVRQGHDELVIGRQGVVSNLDTIDHTLLHYFIDMRI